MNLQFTEKTKSGSKFEEEDMLNSTWFMIEELNLVLQQMVDRKYPHVAASNWSVGILPRSRKWFRRRKIIARTSKASGLVSGLRLCTLSMTGLGSGMKFVGL